MVLSSLCSPKQCRAASMYPVMVLSSWCAHKQCWCMCHAYWGLVFFGCSVGSCHFDILLGLLLPNLTVVRHANAKCLLVLFGCSVGSCHACLCSKHITCYCIILMVLSQTMLLRVSCMLRPKPYWFSLDAVLGQPLQTCKMKQLPCSADNCAAEPIIMLSSLCPPKKCCCWCHACQGLSHLL
jgi:hypothetical protein